MQQRAEAVALRAFLDLLEDPSCIGDSAGSPDRLAGVIMLTDGNVHDVPGNAAALGFDAPVHALLTGKPGEFDRRLATDEAFRASAEQRLDFFYSRTPFADPRWRLYPIARER